MIHYWHNLNERERLIVVIGIGITVGYLIYLLLYAPLANAISAKTKQLGEQQNTLIWLQTVAKQPKGEKTPQTITNSKLLSLVANQLNTAALKPYPYHLQQTSAGDIQLSYEQVPFNVFLQWLWQLSTDYTITIKQLNIERSNVAGVVKLMAIIAAASSS